MTSAILVVGSGRGGAGKTTLAIQAALAHARRGRRVVLVDAALGLASADLFLGVASVRDLSDVLRQRCDVEEALVEVADGFALLPGSAGAPDIAELDATLLARLHDLLRDLASTHDVVVVDTCTGLHAAALAPVPVAARMLLVLTPDLPSIVGSYALARTVSLLRPDLVLDVVANFVDVEREGQDAFWRLRQALVEGLGVEAQLLCSIPRDALVRGALSLQSPLPPAPGGRGAAAGFARLERALCGPAEDVVPAAPGVVFPFRQADAPVFAIGSRLSRFPKE